MVTEGEFTCALCGDTFFKGRPDAEALAEMRGYFGTVPESEPLAVVCDDCFRVIDPANHPHKVEETAAEIARGRIDRGAPAAKQYFVEYGPEDRRKRYGPFDSAVEAFDVFNRAVCAPGHESPAIVCEGGPVNQYVQVVDPKQGDKADAFVPRHRGEP